MIQIKNKPFSHIAFTLAETMIAMVMVGALAAILIPTVMRLVPDTNAVMFKKAYSTLETTIGNMISNEAYYSSSLTGTDVNLTTVPRGFNNTTASSGSGTYNKFCYLFFDQLNTVSGGSASCPLVAASGTSTAVITSDGISWYVYVPYADSTATGTNTATTTEWPLNPSYYTTKIIVDVNGTKAPNCTADTYGATAPFAYGYTASCNNPDRFIIGVRYDGKLQIGCTTAVGTVCAATTDTRAVAILSNPTLNTR